METAEVNIKATTCREMMALKATSEPMLMTDKRAEMRHDKKTALAGICRVGWTWHIQLAKGRPLSRAKANVWRDVDALKETFDAMTRINTMTVSALTPPVDTACWNTYMKGKPDGSSRAVSTEGMAKRKVTKNTSAIKPLPT